MPSPRKVARVAARVMRGEAAAKVITPEDIAAVADSTRAAIAVEVITPVVIACAMETMPDTAPMPAATTRAGPTPTGTMGATTDTTIAAIGITAPATTITITTVITSAAQLRIGTGAGGAA